MKSETYIKKLLAEKIIELKSYGKPAIVTINAPLALIQSNLERQVKALRQILEK